jgi:hypothetical protein
MDSKEAAAGDGASAADHDTWAPRVKARASVFVAWHRGLPGKGGFMGVCLICLKIRVIV